MVWLLGNGLWLLLPLQSTLIQRFSKLICFGYHHHLLFCYCGRRRSCQLRAELQIGTRRDIWLLGQQTQPRSLFPMLPGRRWWAPRTLTLLSCRLERFHRCLWELLLWCSQQTFSPTRMQYSSSCEYTRPKKNFLRKCTHHSTLKILCSTILLWRTCENFLFLVPSVPGAVSVVNTSLCLPTLFFFYYLLSIYPKHVALGKSTLKAHTAKCALKCVVLAVDTHSWGLIRKSAIN